MIHIKKIVSLILIICIIFSFSTYPVVHADAMSLAIGGYMVDKAIFIFGLKAAAVLAVTYGAYKFSQSDMAHRIAISINNMNDTVKNNIKEFISSGKTSISSSEYERLGITEILKSIYTNSTKPYKPNSYTVSGQTITTNGLTMLSPLSSYNVNSLSEINYLLNDSFTYEILYLDIKDLYLYYRNSDNTIGYVSPDVYYLYKDDVYKAELVKTLEVNVRNSNYYGNYGDTRFYLAQFDGKLIIDYPNMYQGNSIEVNDPNFLMSGFISQFVDGMKSAFNTDYLGFLQLLNYAILNKGISVDLPLVNPTISENKITVPKSISLENSLDLEIDGYNIESDNLIDLESTGIKTRIMEENPSLTETIDIPLTDTDVENPDIPGQPELTGISGILSSILAFLEGMFSIPDDVNIDLSPLQLTVPIASVFPFSIPFDLKNAIVSLNVPPKIPKWEVDLSDVLVGDVQFTINFEQFEEWAKITRWGFLITFNMGLIILTRRIIGEK